MIITFEGRDWQFDESEITVKQGIAIHLEHGINIAEFSRGLVELDPRALQAGYWLMLQQNGEIRPIAGCDFRAVAFAEAYANARIAELEAGKAREEAEKKKAEEEAALVPTSLPPGDQAWSGPGYQTVMTPQPIEQQYLPQHAPTGYSPSP